MGAPRRSAGVKERLGNGCQSACRAIFQNALCKRFCGTDPDKQKQVEEEEPEERDETHEEKRKRWNQEDKEECRAIFLFFIYLMFFTGALLLESSPASARIAEHIKFKAKGIGHSLELADITTTAKFFDYLQGTFIPNFYENNTDTQIARAITDTFHPMDAQNRIIGSIRMRQVRVQPTDACQVSPLFSAYTISCLSAYGAVGGSEDSFGANGMFSFEKDGTGTEITGELGTYSPHGFIAFLSTNRTKAEEKAAELRADNFLDAASRAIFLDFTVWSPNTGVYGVTTVYVEFGAAGGTKASVDVLVLSEMALVPGGLGSTPEMAAFILVLLVMVFVIWYLIEEGKELKDKRLSYFADGWNVLDWVNMVLLIIAFTFRCMVFSDAAAANFGKAQLENRSAFQNMRSIAEKAEMVRLLHAFNAVLLWMKCVKYFRHVPKLKTLIRTVWKAFSLFIPFLCMFMVAFIGFAMAYNIGFGDKIAEFSTFSQSAVFLARSFVLDIELMPAYYDSPSFGAGMILVFYITIVLVGSSVFLAIVADSIYRAKYEKQPTRDEDDSLCEPFSWFGKALKHVGGRAGGVAFANVLMVSPKLQKFVVKKFKVQAVKRDGVTMVERVPEALENEKDFMAMDDTGFLNPMALADGFGGGDESVSSYTEDEGPVRPSRTQLLRAIEHMSGRVLSELSIVGIEIRSELHDVCERVAQMQMAVEELLARADRTVAEQRPYIR